MKSNHSIIAVNVCVAVFLNLSRTAISRPNFIIDSSIARHKYRNKSCTRSTYLLGARFYAYKPFPTTGGFVHWAILSFGGSMHGWRVFSRTNAQIYACICFYSNLNWLVNCHGLLRHPKQSKQKPIDTPLTIV